MRFGSVCSGIEAASVAWHPLGWKAAWLSEIEPFPSAVLAHHYPDVPNLGDMTTLPERILSGEVEAPDLFCGGTPCQAFSVAGLRNSLDDARGNLSLTFVGIANAIDHVRSVRRDAPGIIFWENVPGVLSTKDNAFGCFLGALAGEDDPIVPPGEKWTNAGCVYGPQRAVAWRTFDAQYFGVAQRRRRVFVVASARADFDPAAVLFEFDSVRRDIAPSRETGQSITGCLDARANRSVGVQDASAGFVRPVTTHRMVAFGEYSDDGTASAMKARDYKDATDLVAQPVVVHGTQDPCVSDIAFAQGRNNGGENVLAYTTKLHNTTSNQAGKVYEEYATSLDANSPPPAVFQPISIQDVRPVEKAQNGKGWNDDGTAYTVDTHATQGVAQPIPFDTTQITSAANYSKPKAGDPCHPLAAGAHPPAVAQPIAFAQNQRDEVRIMQVAGALAAEPGAKQQTYLAQPMAFDSMNQVCNPHVTHTLRVGRAADELPMTLTTMQVRRLTPVECERLQGFPDGYTNIPWRKKPESPDGPRYKALGNSWAVPNVRWIGKRIQEALNALP